MTNKIFRRSSGRGNVFRRLAAAGTISAFIVSNGSLTLGFQPAPFVPSSSRLVQSPPTGFSIKPASTTTMLYGPLPWDPDCGELLEPFHHETDGLQSPFGNVRYGARIHASPSVAFQRLGLRIGDPEIADTEDSYQLTFDLPTEVEQSSFDASVSGSLLTVEVRVTRDTSERNDLRLLEGWVIKHSSRTDSASRSFLLPDDVSSSSVETAWPSDGRVQVKFIKDITHSNFPDDESAAVSQRAAMPTTDGSKTRSDKTTPLSVSAQYLSSLSEPPATKSDAWSPKLEEPTAKAPSPLPHGAASPSSVNTQPPPIRSSLFDTTEQELDEFTKAIEKKFVLRRLPRWEEMAKRAAEAAKEAKARRVVALRRAMMDVKISESEGGESYLVKVDLPQHATRDNIGLAVLPSNALRVTFAPDDGRRPVDKDVQLPKDALLSQVSAKFDLEKAEDGAPSSSSPPSAEEERVSSLQVTVGKETNLEAKNIDIL